LRVPWPRSQIGKLDIAKPKSKVLRKPASIPFQSFVKPLCTYTIEPCEVGIEDYPLIADRIDQWLEGSIPDCILGSPFPHFDVNAPRF
jgi:hypothetical protein